MKVNRITVTDIPNTNLKKITLKNDFLEVVLLNYGAPPSTFDAKQK